MWNVKYIDETSGSKKVITETMTSTALEEMFKHDAGGIVTLKDWEEIVMKIEVMMQGVDLKNGVYKKIAFTGHRPDKLGGYDTNSNTNPVRVAIKNKLNDICSYMILNRGTEEFMEGMAQGVDQDAGNVILNIISSMASESDGSTYVTLHAAVPYIGQESVWPKEAQGNYRTQLKRIADIDDSLGKNVHYLHTVTPPTKWDAIKWLDERNHYMVDWCDLLIGVWNGTSGGTKNAIDYAKKMGKPILLLKFTL